MPECYTTTLACCTCGTKRKREDDNSTKKSANLNEHDLIEKNGIHFSMVQSTDKATAETGNVIDLTLDSFDDDSTQSV